jgi:hypothetical protein
MTSKPLRAWAPKISLLFCTLALLGTSKHAGWAVTATPAHPNAARSDRVLEITVESSAPPQLHTAQDTYATGDKDTPCLQHWSAGKPLTCVFPAELRLESVTAGGPCKGCDGKCAPPTDAFVRVKTREAMGWRDTKTFQLDTPLPQHAKDWIGTRFLLTTEGAAFIRAKFVVAPKGGGTPLFTDEQNCRLDQSSPTATRSHCFFLVSDDLVPRKIDAVATVEVVGLGLCKDDAACAPPGTLRIESLRVEP